MQTLKDFDMCCSIVGLNYGGNRRYKSPVGGILSISVLLISFGITAFYLDSFFKRKTTKMSFENLKHWDPPSHDVSKDFNIAIMTKYNGKEEIREDILKIQAFYYDKTETTQSLSPIQQIPCNRSNYQNQITQYDSLKLDKAICFDFTGLKLKGNSITQDLNYIQIKFLLCVEEEHCYTKNHSDIENFFEAEKPIAYLYFLDSVFQGNNRKEMNISFINYLDVNVTYKNAKVTNIYFSNNEMRIDDNFFFPITSRKISKYMIDYFRDLVSVRTEQQREVLSINLLSSKNQEVIDISYMQLSELLANVSALVNVVIFLLTGIGEYINNYFFQNDLLTALYAFKSENKKLEAFKKKLKKIRMKFEKKSLFELDTPQNTCDMNLISNDFEKKKMHKSSENIEQVSKLKTLEKLNGKPESEVGSYEIRKTNSRINQSRFAKKKKEVETSIVVEREFTISEILSISIAGAMGALGRCGKCGKLKHKYYLVQKQMFLFQEIIHVFQKLQEIDLLKFLLLNGRQQSLYRIIPKPVLKIEDEKDKRKKNREINSFSSFYNKKETHYLKTNQEILNIIKNNDEKGALVEMFKNKDKSEIDEKLFHIFEERFMSY